MAESLPVSLAIEPGLWAAVDSLMRCGGSTETLIIDDILDLGVVVGGPLAPESLAEEPGGPAMCWQETRPPDRGQVAVKREDNERNNALEYLRVVIPAMIQPPVCEVNGAIVDFCGVETLLMMSLVPGASVKLGGLGISNKLFAAIDAGRLASVSPKTYKGTATIRHTMTSVKMAMNMAFSGQGRWAGDAFVFDVSPYPGMA